MKKIVEISGMSCEHCRMTAEKALNEINGVEAKVDLKKNRAIVKSAKDIDDEMIKNALKAVDFEATEIKEKKGLFD